MAEAEQTLFRQLHGDIQEENWDQVETTSRQILATSPKDKDATLCLVTALLQASKFEAATAVIEKSEFKEDLAFAQAYALYKTQHENEGLNILNKISKKKPGHHHLEAQINYRLGKYERCIDIYDKNFASKDFDPELQTNRLAAFAQLGGNNIPLLPSSITSYEVVFNHSLCLLASGDVQGSVKQLERAVELCNNGMDDKTPEEVKDEQALLSIQKGYILQLQGNVEEAMNIYTAALNDKPSDEAAVATALNNIVTLRGKEEKLFDSLKRMERASKVAEYKLSQSQKRAILLNRCLLLLGKKGEDQDLEVQVAAHQREFPESEFPTLVMAFLFSRKNLLDKSIACLDTRLKDFPQSIQTRLTKAQLLQQQGKGAAASETLKALPVPFCHRPAVVATRVAQAEKDNDIKEAKTILQTACEFWKQAKPDAKLNTTNIARIRTLLVEQSANFHFRHGFFGEAGAMLEQLIDQVPAEERGTYTSKLVIASAGFNPALAQKYAQSLPKIDDPAIDGAALEAIVGSVKKTGRENKRKKEEGEVEEKKTAQQQKKKKKKNIRYPKGFDPKNPGPKPDPERWLPQYERSYYKPKGRKNRTKNAIKGAQGTSKDDAKPFEVSDEVVSSNKSSSQSSAMQRKALKAKKGRRKN